jgi:hypothetical protein
MSPNVSGFRNGPGYSAQNDTTGDDIGFARTVEFGRGAVWDGAPSGAEPEAYCYLLHPRPHGSSRRLAVGGTV